MIRHTILPTTTLASISIQIILVATYHGSSGEGSDVLQRGGFRSSGSNDDGVLHGIVLLKGLDELSNGGSLLTDGDVDAVKLLGLVVAYKWLAMLSRSCG
jgi:hypothetical protein